MKFDAEHPNWRLPYLQDASNLPSSNIPSIRWYKAPNNVNLEGGRPGKGRRFGLEAFFFRANALPLWHHFWPKENKFPIPPTKTRGQMCFIESSNIPTFGENLIRFKMLSVYKKAHQLCQLTFIGVQQNAIFLNFMEQTFKIDRMMFSIFIRSSTFSNFYCELL